MPKKTKRSIFNANYRLKVFSIVQGFKFFLSLSVHQKLNITMVSIPNHQTWTRINQWQQRHQINLMFHIIFQIKWNFEQFDTLQPKKKTENIKRKL